MELTNSLSPQRTSPFSAVTTIFYDPARAFEMLEQRTYAWVPLFLLIAATGALFSWYFSIVDFAWLQDQILASIPDAESREQARKVMTERMIKMSTIGSAVLMLPVSFAIFGVYFMIAGKFVNKEISFSGAFALSAWSSMPTLLLLPLGAIQIFLSSNGQLDMSALNPLSLNQLFFQYEMAHPLAGLLDAVSLLSVWGIVLAVLGFQAWAKVSRASAVKVVVPPYVVFYGIWFAYALSQTA